MRFQTPRTQDPTQEQIAEMTAQIRKQWTATQRRSRDTGAIPEGVQPKVFKLIFKPKKPIYE